MQKKFALLDVVIILHDMPIYGILKNTLGTIIMIYEDSDIAYEVEFTDSFGQTVAQVVLSGEDIAPYAD